MVAKRIQNHSGRIHLNHLVKGTTVKLRVIKRAALVGYARFVNPSPKV